eukprot:m.16791 g.16791  ORF g.16791 m.16791 type:complete len:209 (+) comp3177_c0_seq1:59-685(+)
MSFLYLLLLPLEPLDWALRTARAAAGLVLALPFLVLAAARGGWRTPLLTLWDACAHVPLGQYAATFVVGLIAPYSASMGAVITKLEPGTAEVILPGRPWLRNPFASIHAVALTNLGELASGSAAVSAMEALSREGHKVRGIVSGLQTRFAKKARGTIRATSTVVVPSEDGKHILKAHAVLRDRDGAGDIVAEFTADWTVEVARKHKAT